MLISQLINSCLANHSELCMSSPRNNQSRRISVYTLQRRPSFGFESSVSSASMTSGDPVSWPNPPLTTIEYVMYTSGFVDDVTFSHNGPIVRGVGNIDIDAVKSSNVIARGRNAV